MNKTGLSCPNCGSTIFAEVTPDKQQCAYCGTVLALPEAKQPEADLALVTCYRCGVDNPQGARYCNHCAAPLEGAAALFGRLKNNLAVVSIAVTVFGSLLIPFAGAIAGLVLAYRARRQARDDKGDERLARTAILLGWCFLALGLLPICLVLFSSSVQMGYSACDTLVSGMRDMVPWR